MKNLSNVMADVINGYGFPAPIEHLIAILEWHARTLPAIEQKEIGEAVQHLAEARNILARLGTNKEAAST